MPQTFYTEEEVESLLTNFARSYHRTIGLANRLYDVMPLLESRDISELKKQEDDLTILIDYFNDEYNDLIELHPKFTFSLSNYEEGKYLENCPGIIARIQEQFKKEPQHQ